MDKGDVVLKFPIAFESVKLLTEFPVVFPFVTTLAFLAFPAKLNTLLLQCTRNERAADSHSEGALAPCTSALALRVIARTESAGKPAYTDFRIVHLQNLNPRLVPWISRLIAL